VQQISYPLLYFVNINNNNNNNNNSKNNNNKAPLGPNFRGATASILNNELEFL